MAKDKADFEIVPTPVDFRNLFKAEKNGVVVRTTEDDKKIKIVLPKFDIDDIDELTNARDYLDEIIEELEEMDDRDDDDDDDDDEDEEVEEDDDDEG